MRPDSDISIYSLDYPPVPIDRLSQLPALNNQSPKSNHTILIIIAVVVIAVVLIGVLYYKKRNRIKIKATDDSAFPLKSKEEISQIQENNYYNFTRNSICFLNGFNVMDKDGNNVKGQFTPTLKNLLILLILSTEKDNNGIFGNKLIQLLWFDKNEEAAKNNRNVYISKLRSILENVGCVEIINKNGFWSIALDKNIRCDYIKAMRLFSSIEEENFKDPIQINKLLELLLRGVLLPNTEIDWLDNFKSTFSNMTIDFLTKLSRKEEYSMDNQLRLKISDMLFLHDLINEEALYIKCSILFNSGKKGIAKNVYDNFCKEYYNLLGINYKYSLVDILNRNNP